METVEESLSVLEADPVDPHGIRRVGTKIDEVLGYGFTTVRGRALELKARNEAALVDQRVFRVMHRQIDDGRVTVIRDRMDLGFGRLT